MNSIRYGVAALALMAPSVALAGGAADVVRSFYLENLGFEADPLTRDFYTEPALSQLAANDRTNASGDAGCVDFGLAVDAQDFDPEEVANSLKLGEKTNGDTTIVSARFTNFTEPREIEWSLKNIDGKWLVSDIAGITSNWRLSEFECD